MISEKQQKILRFRYSDYDAIICDGAIRSGKTSIMMWAFAQWAMANFNRKKFGICGATVDSAIKNVVEPFQNMRKANQTYAIKWNSTKHLLTLRTENVTNVFEVFGGKDESSYKLIQGRTLSGVLLDEVALMPKSFVEQAIARCSEDGSKLWYNCNPSNPQHWFYNDWIKEHKDKNALYLHFNMYDNPHLSERVLRRYENLYTGVFYERYIKGKWVSAEGVVYDMFDKDRNVIDKYEYTAEKPYYISSDYGIQNATVFEFWQKNDDGKWVDWQEYYYSGRENMKQKTVSELVDDLVDMCPKDDEGEIIFPEYIIVDPSATALIVELKKRDFRVKKAKNEVIKGIQDVSSALRTGLLLFCKCCKNAIREFGTYAWDDKATQRGEDAPLKTDDHCMDSIRYFTETMKLIPKRNEAEMDMPILEYI